MGPRVRARRVRVGPVSVTAKDLALRTPDGLMSAYEARPRQRALGVVVVAHEAFGLDEYVRDTTRAFAAEGYLAVAPDFYYRVGGGTLPYDRFSVSRILPFLDGLDDAALMQDLDAVIDHVRDENWAPVDIGIVGFSFGGRIAFLAATRRRLGAAVTFYGGNIVADRYGVDTVPPLLGARLKTPWLGLFADEDRAIPPSDVQRLRASLADSPVAWDVVQYPGVDHGFHCHHRSSFDPAAAADGWKRCCAWLDHHLIR